MDTFADASIPGATADQQKVLAVVKNNDTEEGADISTDFAHLGSEYFYSILHVLLSSVFTKYFQWARTNFKKF